MIGQTNLDESYIFEISIKMRFFYVVNGIKIPFFRVLVNIEPGRSLPQFVTTNCLIKHTLNVSFFIASINVNFMRLLGLNISIYWYSGLISYFIDSNFWLFYAFLINMINIILHPYILPICLLWNIGRVFKNSLFSSLYLFVILSLWLINFARGEKLPPGISLWGI